MNDINQNPDRIIHYNPMIVVKSIEEVPKHPVAPGNSVSFMDENSSYIYTKTQGPSPMDKPECRAFEINEVDFESLLPENKKLAGLATVEQVNQLTSVIQVLANEVSELKGMVVNSHTNDNSQNDKGGKKYDGKK